VTHSCSTQVEQNQEGIPMKVSKSLFNMGFTFVYAATFSLVVGAHAQTLKTVGVFDGNDGYGVSAPVVQATDGNFYGTTSTGGFYYSGTLFRMTPTGEVTDLFNFCSEAQCANGSNPVAGPVLGSDGNLYGVVGSGGHNNSGIFYKSTLDGDFTTVYEFCATYPCTDGGGPNGIFLASDGNFYGTAGGGGNASNSGTIFSISLTGQLKLLYTFCAIPPTCEDGASPDFGPVQGNDGNLYGVTLLGGTMGGGVLYELTSTGIYSVLHDFCDAYTDGCNGSEPYYVVRDANGNLFGTTAYGGNNKSGTVFELTATGQYIVLYSFPIDNGPTWPYTGLMLASDGNIYGVSGGGRFNGGLIYEITQAGEYRTLHNFLSTNYGWEPTGPMSQGTNGDLYGTTSYGPGEFSGSVFSLSYPSLKPIVETVPVAGPVGQGVIILGNGLTGSTSVKFNGVTAEFTVKSDTCIQATVPASATTGTVSVVTPTGTLNSYPQFLVSK
jgi:uncharacterized repeat protein (TIGR03803 family)